MKKKKKINSKAKGAAGERELKDFLRSLGFEARRTQQYAGNTGDASDVVVEAWSSTHIECKRCETFQGIEWLAQAVKDAKDKLPVVFWRKSRGDWICLMEAKTLVPILNYLELSKYRI